MKKYTTVQGDMLDLIAYREYGAESATDHIYTHNPQLADLPLVLEAGIEINLPELPIVSDKIASGSLSDR